MNQFRLKLNQYKRNMVIKLDCASRAQFCFQHTELVQHGIVSEPGLYSYVEVLELNILDIETRRIITLNTYSKYYYMKIKKFRFFLQINQNQRLYIYKESGLFYRLQQNV